MKFILVVSHGSQSPRTKEEVISLVEILRQRSGNHNIGFAFLEIEHPSIPEGIELCVSRGAREIILLLNFLNSGKHVDEDIPAIVTAARRKYPHIDIKISLPVGQHSGILNLFLDMMKS
jgi:sirohydrochlorin ferrochelatase